MSRFITITCAVRPNCFYHTVSFQLVMMLVVVVVVVMVVVVVVVVVCVYVGLHISTLLSAVFLQLIIIPVTVTYVNHLVK